MDLSKEAAVFARDLGALPLFAAAPEVAAVTPDQIQPVDIVLAVGAVEANGFDPYKIRSSATTGLVITAATDKAVWNGTRTVLQSLKGAGGVQAGTVTDWADYGVRSLHVDAARKYFTPGWFKDQIKRLSLYKLNEIQFHFSENEGFRLEVKGYPEVLSADYISQAELAEIIEVAGDYHVDVVPAMDVPGHMKQVLTAHPEWSIGSDSVGQKVLDYSKEAPRKFVTDVITELAPLFPSKKWHLGGDEVFDPNRLHQLPSQYPQLAKYARDNVHANATVLDGYMHYLGTVDAALNAAGFETVRAWNDALYTGPHGTLPADVQVTYWTKWHRTMPSTDKLIQKGHKLINYHDGFFYYVLPACPTCAYNQRVPASAIYDNWVPTLFSGNQQVAREHVLGSSYAIWADKPNLETEEVVANGVRLPLAAMAERVYSPGVSTVPYTVWNHRVDVIDGLKTGFPPAPPADRAIPVDNITVTADSEETNREPGQATNVLDGRTNTIWHTKWSSGTTPLPHHLIFDLKREYPVDGLRYVPRQDLSQDPRNSMIKGYKIYVSTDGQSWGSPVATGNFRAGADTQEVDFEKVNARYVKFEATSAQIGRQYASAAEVRILASEQPAPPPAKIATPVASIEKSDVPGTGSDTYTIPTTEGVVYKVGDVAQTAGVKTVPSGTTSVVITAEAAEGYTLAEGATTRYELTFSTEGGEASVTPSITPTAAPTVVNLPEELVKTDAPGTGSDTIVIPDIEGVEFLVKAEVVPAGIYRVPAGTYTVLVTARAKEGFAINPQTPPFWTVLFSTDSGQPSATPSVTPTAAPTVVNLPEELVKTDAPGTGSDTIVIPDIEGVEFLVKAEVVPAGIYRVPAGTYTVLVTARAKEGFAINPQTPPFWTVLFSTDSGQPSATPSAEPTQTPSVEPTQTPTPTAPGVETGASRIAGTDRVGTALQAFAERPVGVKHVLLTTGREYADAVAAGPLAKALNAPILLTVTPTLEESVFAAIKEAKIEKVTILGGEKAVSSAAEAKLKSNGVEVDRIDGMDRFETAARIATRTAKELGAPAKIFVADGTNFPDALAAGVAAANSKSVLVLSNGNRLPNASNEVLKRYKSAHVVAAGGAAARALRTEGYIGGITMTVVSGGNRYETAARLAGFTDGAQVVYLASGQNFPDALAGGAAAASNNAVLLLTEANRLPVETKKKIQEGNFKQANVLGGTSTVSKNVFDEVKSLLK
ncbi:MAG: cell wall-binding repeat-containing protein [Buchananella hordeovulneris]|nr:cell wall-binding repeat-containing protein [Buchananella hordeovulneris]